MYLSSLYALIEEHSQLKKKIDEIIQAEFSEIAYNEIIIEIHSSYLLFSEEQ